MGVRIKQKTKKQEADVKLEALKEEYLESLRVKNYSSSTISTKFYHLKAFLEYLQKGSIENLEGLTEEMFLSYQKYRYYYENIYGKRDSAKTQNEHVTTIKLFFRYLLKKGYINHNPADVMERAREPKKLPLLALTDKEMKKFLKQPDESTEQGYRDRTILEVLYSTGIRNSELCNLNLSDVQLEEGLLRIRLGKGQKDRMVPMGKLACGYIENYIKYVRPKYYHADKNECLFMSRKGGRMEPQSVLMMIKKCAKRKGFKKNITTHTFRRSCATEMIRRKANPMYVKELLGHTDYRSIQRYCNLSIVDLKKAHEKYHPREKMGV